MEESSYNEDDNIELEECFEKLESEILTYKNRKEEEIQLLEQDNTFLQEQQEAKNQEIG